MVSGQVADCNPVTLALTGDENKLIRFFSTADCQIQALPRGEAVIVQQKIAGVSVTENRVEIPSVETGTFLFQAADSRGYKGEYTAEKELIPYEKLTAVASARRLSPTEDRAEITVSGVCFWGSFGVQENTLQVFCYVGSTPIELSVTPVQNGYTARGVVEGLSYLHAHNLLVVAYDKLMQAQFPVLVNAGIPVFDWGKGDFTFHVPVTLADGSQAISRQEVLALLEELTHIT